MAFKAGKHADIYCNWVRISSIRDREKPHNVRTAYRWIADQGLSVGAF